MASPRPAPWFGSPGCAPRTGKPLAIETAVVRPVFLPSADLVDQSLYAALARPRVRPATGVQRLHAALATGGGGAPPAHP